MKWLLVLIIFFSICRIASAEELTLSNGKVYSDYTITRVEPDGISIKHAAGIIKVYFWELPADIQQKYNYDAAKAQEYRQQSINRQAAIYAKQKEAAKRAQDWAEFEATYKDIKEKIRSSATELVGEVLQITDDGALISDAKVPYRYKEEVVTPGYTSMNSNRRYTTRTKYIPAAAEYEPVFVIGGGNGFTDGQSWTATVYPAGTYKYTPVSGGGKTVKCYALTPEDAFEHMRRNP